MAELNSFCDLPRRDDMRQFSPARSARLSEKPSVIRESRSGAVLQALMDMQDQIRKLQLEKSSLNSRFEELSEEAARYRADIGARSSRPGQTSVVRELERTRDRLERSRLSSSSASSSQASPVRRPSHHVDLDYEDTDSTQEQDSYSDDVDGDDDPGYDSDTSTDPDSRPPIFHHSSGKHYHLSLSHLPFVVGQSTAPSHSVAGSLQAVLAQLKKHHPIICDHVQASRPRRHHHHHRHCTVQDSCRSTIASRAKQVRPQTAPAGAAHARAVHQSRRQVLQDMRTLHTTLQRDDVCWS